MTDNQAIQTFFDEMSTNRDGTIAAKPLLTYEQETRLRAVLDLLKPNAKDMILDIGCGNARDIRVLSRYGFRSVGVDLSIGMLFAGQNYMKTHNLSGASFLAVDGTELPFSNASFTKVVCSEVIEHIPEWHNLIKETYRILEPGGLFILTTPNWLSLYGLNRLIWEAIRDTFTSSKSIHPYDKWKTQREVISVLQQAEFRIEQTLGSCYVPGYGWTIFPNFVQQAVVNGVRPIEEWLRSHLSGFGYTIAIAGRKVA